MDNYICLDIGGTNIRAALFINDEIQPVKQIKIGTQLEQVILSKEYLKGLTITKTKLGGNAGLLGALFLIKINHLQMSECYNLNLITIMYLIIFYVA